MAVSTSARSRTIRRMHDIRASSRNEVARPLPPAEPPMVGREQEWATLRDEWGRTLDGGLALALISGEPGIGKSRLARELASIAQADGAKVLLGSCSAEPLLPYQPFIEALEGSGEAMEHERLLQLRSKLQPVTLNLLLDKPRLSHNEQAYPRGSACRLCVPLATAGSGTSRRSRSFSTSCRARDNARLPRMPAPRR